MALDITRIVGAVTREISDREHEGQTARVLTAERTYETHREDLWHALTNAERIPRWFLPISGDLRLGGRYQLEGNAGGKITGCEPPRHLAITWEWAGDTSWVEVTLSEEAEGITGLRLEHIAHTDPAFWDQYGPGAAGVGWDLSLLGLQELFADKPAVVPEQAEEWALSEEGRRLARLSSDAWAAASIAFGTSPEAALAAGERTTAFYTGEESAGKGDGNASGD